MRSAQPPLARRMAALIDVPMYQIDAAGAPRAVTAADREGRTRARDVLNGAGTRL